MRFKFIRKWLRVKGLGFSVSLFICFTLLSNPIFAKPNINQNVLKQAESYLNNIRTLKANFTQVAANGQISSGVLYLKRAGKMRWEYNPPTPIIMVTRGTFLRYYDHELEQISDIPIEGTIAAYLAKENINFADNDITVLEASSIDGVQVVRITSRKAPDEGEISFVFSERPYVLKNILTKDGKGEETTIALDDATQNLTIDDEIFAIFDPNINKRKRR
jgi:outer membrane lipoprotein-sorting protein